MMEAYNYSVALYLDVEAPPVTSTRFGRLDIRVVATNIDHAIAAAVLEYADRVPVPRQTIRRIRVMLEGPAEEEQA